MPAKVHAFSKWKKSKCYKCRGSEFERCEPEQLRGGPSCTSKTKLMEEAEDLRVPVGMRPWLS